MSVNKPYCTQKVLHERAKNLTQAYAIKLGSRHADFIKRVISRRIVNEMHTREQCQDCAMGKLFNIAWLALFLLKLRVLRLEKHE